MALNLKNNKLIEVLKNGFKDLVIVLQEGNFKLFLKQGITILLVFLLFRHVTGKNVAQMDSYRTEMDAIVAQRASENEYLHNKEKLLDLEPQFPDIDSKNEWLLSQILGIFREGKLVPQVNGDQSEDVSNGMYVAAGYDVSTNANYFRFADFLADIENREELLKVSSFTIKKDTNPSNLGNNQISMRINTIFPKEKIASRMFKDYEQQVAKRRQKQGEENNQ